MKNKTDNKQLLKDFNMNDFVGSHTGSSSKETSKTVSSDQSQPSDEAYAGKRSQDIKETAGNVPTIETTSITDSVSDKPIKKTISTKQRKASLQEYQQTFLTVPKITDRKTVFISNELRERIVDIVRKLGTEKSSVSGFVENLVKAHLLEYEEETESWKKL